MVMGISRSFLESLFLKSRVSHGGTLGIGREKGAESCLRHPFLLVIKQIALINAHSFDWIRSLPHISPSGSVGECCVVSHRGTPDMNCINIGGRRHLNRLRCVFGRVKDLF